VEQLLWTFEDLRRFTTHPDTPVREWAVERLIKHFPDQAGDVLVTLVDDPRGYAAFHALEFLGLSGQGDKYGPILLEQWPRIQGDNRGHLAMALARLGYRPAIPLIVRSLQQPDRQASLNETMLLAHAASEFGDDEARRVLWGLLEQTPASAGLLATFLFDLLLRMAQPEDKARLIAQYRALPPGQFGRTPLSVLADSVGVGRMVDEMKRKETDDLAAMLKQAAWWMGVEPSLSQTVLDELAEAIKPNHSGVVEALLREAHRIVAARGDDLAGWEAAWAAGQRPVGYRQRTLYTLFILEELAARPAAEGEQRRQESVLALGIVTQLSVDRDDQAYLERATDQPAALLDILTSPREHVLPDIIERVADLGPDIVPRLRDRFNPADFSWGLIRLIRVLEQLARRYPGSCNAAAPPLIDAIFDEQGDFTKEAATDALEAIGPPAVPLINDTLRRSRDLSKQIYLTGVLSEIPVASATEVILARLKAGRPMEEFELDALARIGHPAAIEPMARLWRPGDRLLAEYLLLLCELNGVNRPELPEWRRLVQQEEERMARLNAGEFDLLEGLKNLANAPKSLQRTWELEPKQAKPLSDGSKKKGVSTKERKKRAAQRRQSKKKKR